LGFLVLPSMAQQFNVNHLAMAFHPPPNTHMAWPSAVQSTCNYSAPTLPHSLTFPTPLPSPLFYPGHTPPHTPLPPPPTPTPHPLPTPVPHHPTPPLTPPHLPPQARTMCHPTHTPHPPFPTHPHTHTHHTHEPGHGRKRRRLKAGGTLRGRRYTHRTNVRTTLPRRSPCYTLRWRSHLAGRALLGGLLSTLYALPAQLYTCRLMAPVHHIHPIALPPSPELIAWVVSAGKFSGTGRAEGRRCMGRAALCGRLPPLS